MTGFVTTPLIKVLFLANLLFTTAFVHADAIHPRDIIPSFLENCERYLHPATQIDFFDTIRGLPKDRNGKLHFHFLFSKYFALVGDFEAYVRNQTLRFDISIRRPYRGRGLYQKLLDHTLKLYPEVTSIPAEMPFNESDNAQIFLQQLFRTDDLNVAKENMNLKFRNIKKINDATPSQIMEWRARMIDAYYQMPAAKARERAGFGRLEKLTLAQDVGCVEFNTVKGSRSDANDVQIFVTPKVGQVVELKANGKVLPSYLEATNVGRDYIRTWEPCHQRGLVEEL